MAAAGLGGVRRSKRQQSYAMNAKSGTPMESSSEHKRSCREKKSNNTVEWGESAVKSRRKENYRVNLRAKIRNYLKDTQKIGVETGMGWKHATTGGGRGYIVPG